ncbi:MAG TPA: DNA polymerase III subunit gamma/tau [Methylophilus sp.]|nr:DNA polymerase III subunit gamma/tau [Methylophilus sp.]HQQ34304.1 DNA polymerase III subunit gamma/tau [Methylophilus sp.]
MSHLVLARKYRPKSFDSLVGQDHVVRALSNALSQNRLHHAYLFTGTRGVGKTTLARILAKSLNCETGTTANPCGQCTACTEIDRGRFVDMIEVDAASNTQVDAMRELLDNAQYAPTVGRFKVYIIDEVHMLSKSAFNAMLKTLEEPPAHVIFILATTDPQKVPVTVLSRCLQFNLRQMASGTVAEHLKNVLTLENIPFEVNAINLLSRAAAGSMRDALSLTDQAIAYGQQSVKEADVRDMLGAIDQSYLFDIIQALVANDGLAMLEKAQQMEARSLSFETALTDLANLLHQIAITQTVPDSIANDLPERGLLLNLAEKLTPETLQLYYQIAVLGRRDIALAPDEYAGFTMTLLRMLAFAPQDSLKNTATHRSTLTTAMPDAGSKPTAEAQAVIQPSATIPVAASAENIQNDTLQPAPALAPRATNFDGNWRNLVENHLKLGLARALAQQCELVNFDEDSLTLRVAESQKHLVNTNYQNKLAEAIQQHFGRKIRLQIEVGTHAYTPAQQNAEEKAERMQNTESAMMQDAFVQNLINDFGATVIKDSIKPL